MGSATKSKFLSKRIDIDRLHYKLLVSFQPFSPLPPEFISEKWDATVPTNGLANIARNGQFMWNKRPYVHSAAKSRSVRRHIPVKMAERANIWSHVALSKLFHC